MKLVLIFPFTSIGIALVVSPANFDGPQVGFHYVRDSYTLLTRPWSLYDWDLTTNVRPGNGNSLRQ
jgi:hypothetical protein